VIEATRVVPNFLETTPGARVDFLNRAQHSVHVEFGADPRQHEVVQVPATGPIWAVFQRPGTHPYVVHVYDGPTTRTLSGVVAVGEDEGHKWDSRTCGLVVMGNCIEQP
jgi:plastocyanin